MKNLKLYLNENKKDIVGYKIKNTFNLIGPSDYVNSWFSNIKAIEEKGFFSKKLTWVGDKSRKSSRTSCLI